MAEKTVYIIDLNDKVTGKLKVVQNEAKKTDSAFSGMTSSLGIGSIGVAGVVAGLGFIGKGIYDLTAGAEQTKIQFEVMLGSVDKAGALIKDIRQFAAATPFETQDLEKAATTMLGFGIAAKDIMPNIKMLGDVSGGNADKFDRITYAFSQISATGRLMGQDLLQLINAGFNPLQTISTKTGISIGQLKKQMEDGLISSQMIAEAFKIETTEGGRFFGMMERQSQTLSGKLGTLVDNVKMIGLGLGQSAQGGMHQFIDAGLKIVDLIGSTHWKSFGNYLYEISFGLRFLVEGIGMLKEVFGAANAQAIGFQGILDSLTVYLKVISLPIRTVFNGFMALAEVMKSFAVAWISIGKGDMSGLLHSFDGLGDRLNKIRNDVTSVFSTDSGVQVNGISKGTAREVKQKPGGPGAFDALGDGTITKKTKRQTAGGLTLNESRNGATNIVFNIDTFQKNEFTKDGVGLNSQTVKNILNDMAMALTTVMNDSQIVARQ
jgi:tape measure domain-containing protein